MNRNGRVLSLLFAALALTACTSQSGTRPEAPPAADTRADIALLETTDLHSNILSYDFYKLGDNPGIGLVRTATLIRQARTQFDNSLLFDAGDTIQGTVLADYQAQVKPLPCSDELAVYKAMDTLGYDAGTIGNHEFNYGLQFLSQVTGTPMNVDGVAPKQCQGPHYPLVLSNVFSAKDGKPLFAPWRVITRKIKTHAPDGSLHEATIRIGLLGFTPTWIMDWDKRNLDGKVTVMGVVEAAQKYLPEVKQAGADIVIAIVHGGIDASPYSARTENAAWHLAGVAGIDAMMLGHSHDVFPNPSDPKSHFAHVPDVDNVRGHVRGVPAVMGDYHGKSMGLLDLAVVWRDKHWQVDREASHAEVRSVKNADGSYVAPDPSIAALVAGVQADTIAYVKTPIGHSDFPMSTYFVAAGEMTALQLVNAAQRDYVQRYVKESLPQYASLPVLGATSPLKAGFGGALDYTDVPAGMLAINNAADLYLYPNVVTAVKIDGAGVKAWLEHSANWFNRIDPTRKDPQELLSGKFPSYNFDMLQGNLTYAIDVTREPGARIVNLMYEGKPVRDDQEFIVATNNYRANGGGRFPGLDGKATLFSSTDGNREVLIDFIRTQHDITRARFGKDRNWHFVPVKTAGPVLFTSAAGKLDFAISASIHDVAVWKDLGNGMAQYSIDLSR